MSSMLPTSPFDIPEIGSLIASYISKDSDLAWYARVSRSLHCCKTCTILRRAGGVYKISSGDRLVPQEDDFDEAGNYDHMAIYDDSDDDVKDVRCYTPRQRALLRQFYSKLGQLSQPQTLNMSNSKFWVRVKDGLELPLPGLQQKLIYWEPHLLENENYTGSSELEFFGAIWLENDYPDSLDSDQD
ncbi:hypothetical protein EC968_001157 [Mortierella alpina]|nr:hypothetical protein EC968_001157 [Mortierella alpina]